MGDNLGTTLFPAVFVFVAWIDAFYGAVKESRKKSAGFSRTEFAKTVFVRSLTLFGMLLGAAIVMSMGFFVSVLVPYLIGVFITSALLYGIALLLYPYPQHWKLVLIISTVFFFITLVGLLFIILRRGGMDSASLLFLNVPRW